MSLLEAIESIQQYSKSDLQDLSKSDLISLVLSSQFTINSLKTSYNWQSAERKVLRDEIRKKRKALKTFDSLYKSLELNPEMLATQSFTNFDTKNFSVKNFVEMQHRKICFQEQKIKELQMKRLKKSICTKGDGEKSLGSICFREEKSKIFLKKLENVLQTPAIVLLHERNFEISRFFEFSDEKIAEHKEICIKEVENALESLPNKYGESIFNQIIAKRSKWDSDYKEIFAENSKIVEKTFGEFLNNTKVLKIIKGSSQGFCEGEVVRTVYSICEKISFTRGRPVVFETLDRMTETDPDMIEIVIKW